MGDEPLPMPQITVRDPRHPDHLADVLVSGGDDRAPLDPARKRRRLRLAGALLLLGGLAVGADDLRERRAEAAQERRLGAVVQLRAEHEGGSASSDATSRTGQLTLQLLLHNDGPRDLHVTAASVAGYDLLRSGVRVAAGRSAPMLLERTVTCDAAAPPVTPPGGLRLTVRTTTVERQVEVPLPVDDDEGARLCGFLPLETMQVGFARSERTAPDVVDLTLDLRTRAIRPVHLVAIVPPQGVAVQPRLQERPRGLPLELEPRDGLERTLSVVLRLTVSDCAAALAPSGPDLPARDPGAMLVQLRDHTGALGDALLRYPEGLVESLVSESCG